MTPPAPSRPLAEARAWDTDDPPRGLLRRALTSGARLLGRARQPPRAAPAAAPLPQAGAPPAGLPPAEAPPRADIAALRRAWADRLWGKGLALPGGTAEVVRLATLLPLTPAHTLLLAGLGARVAGEVVAGARGCFVSAHDLLPPPASPETRGAARRVSAAAFEVGAPGFRPGYHHHAMLLEPFRAGGCPSALLVAAAAALRQGGELVLLDLVARDDALPGAAGRWIAAEGRASPPAEAAVEEALAAAGFVVNVVEDAAPRHRQAVLHGWAAVLDALRAEGGRPATAEAAALVAEAEAWLLRLRLLAEGRLRLVRWHASLARRAG